MLTKWRRSESRPKRSSSRGPIFLRMILNPFLWVSTNDLIHAIEYAKSNAVFLHDTRERISRDLYHPNGIRNVGGESRCNMDKTAASPTSVRWIWIYLTHLDRA